MTNTIIMLSLLLLPYWLLRFANVPQEVRARHSIALVLLFTSIGHFVKTTAMTQILPAWVPGHASIIYLSGIFELFAAAAILVPSVSHSTGIGCAFSCS